MWGTERYECIVCCCCCCCEYLCILFFRLPVHRINQPVPAQVRRRQMGACDCSVLQKKRGRGWAGWGSSPATPRSRSPGGAAVWAQRCPCRLPAGPVAKQACCTADTLSSPPATWWGTWSTSKQNGGMTVRAQNRQTKTFFFTNLHHVLSALKPLMFSPSRKSRSFHDLSTRGQHSLNLQNAPLEEFLVCHCQNKKAKAGWMCWCGSAVMWLLVTSGYFCSLQSAQSPLTYVNYYTALDIFFVNAEMVAMTWESD